MTEADWLAGSNLHAMLAHAVAISHNSEECRRKLRLLACAGCRRIWHVLAHPQSRRAVEVSEEFADDLASWDDLLWAGQAAQRVAAEMERHSQRGWNAAQTAAAAAGDALAAAERAVGSAGDLDMLRDVFGNPFRPVVFEEGWLRWKNGCVVEMARAIYEERQFRDLPFLADALMDAGCTDPAILDHCQAQTAHARGCWVVDALLGKG
jgi:hypothetical protein